MFGTTSTNMKCIREKVTLFSIFYIISICGIPSAHLVGAHQPEKDGVTNHDDASCDAGGRCHGQPVKESKQCFPLPHDQQLLLSSVEDFYRQGLSAQAYKPFAPLKREVCQVGNGSFYSENTFQNWGEDRSFRDPHNFAHRSFWRSNYADVVPLMVYGNIYSCGPPHPGDGGSGGAMAVEVWQPRPDGTFSSLRPGVEEGVCRARVSIDTETDSEFSNIIGTVKFDTLAPGSPGILGGVVPIFSRDYPPYGPGAIHMYLDVDGYYPMLEKLDMNDLDWMLQKDSQGRFRFKGSDMRPHAKRSTKMDYRGAEIQSVERAEFTGYNFALAVKINLYLIPEAEETRSGGLSDVFCSSHGLFSWISSFFKEPIAICFPSLLDFFSL